MTDRIRRWLKSLLPLAPRTVALALLALVFVSPACGQGVESIQGEPLNFLLEYGDVAFTIEDGDGTPEDPYQIDLDELIATSSARIVVVANIDSPSELDSEAGATDGEVVMAVQLATTPFANDYTLYTFDSDYAGGITSPYRRSASGGGAWVAIGGKYSALTFRAAGAIRSAGGLQTNTFGVLFNDAADFSGTNGTLETPSPLSGAQTWTLPDASGTLALTDRPDGTNLLGYVSGAPVTYTGYFRVEVDGNDAATVAGTGTEVDPYIFGYTSGGAPSGPAGGALSGTYPNPGIASDAVGDAELDGSDDFTFSGDNTFNGNNEIAGGLTLSANTLITGTVSGDLIAAENDFRLTGSTGTPVMTSNGSFSTVYLTPYTGNRIALFDGTDWEMHYSAEVSIALSGLTSSRPYDVFAYDSSGTVTLELTSWSSDTARTTGLTTQDGVPVKSGATTRRYLGTLLTNATNSFAFDATGDESGGVFCGLWNVDNQVPFGGILEANVNTWNYTTATWRQCQADADMDFTFVHGIQRNTLSAQIAASSLNTGASGSVPRAVAFGVDSTSTPSGGRGIASACVSLVYPHNACHTYQPGIGERTLTWLEWSTATNTTTWAGDNGGSDFQSAMTVQWWY